VDRIVQCLDSSEKGAFLLSRPHIMLQKEQNAHMILMLSEFGQMKMDVKIFHSRKTTTESWG
jgi:hypothetical protein